MGEFRQWGMAIAWKDSETLFSYYVYSKFMHVSYVFRGIFYSDIQIPKQTQQPTSEDDNHKIGTHSGIKASKICVCLVKSRILHSNSSII